MSDHTHSIKRRSPRGAAVRPNRPAAGQPDALTWLEEKHLVRRAQAGDRQAMEVLVHAHLGLIHQTAVRYRCQSYTPDDLVQEGILGMLTAIERFDLTRGYRLSTYAIHWIRQAISRAATERDRLIRLPTQAMAELRRLNQARNDTLQREGRPLPEPALARHAGLSEPRARLLLEAAEDAVSLETLVGADQDASLLDVTVDPNAPDPEAEFLGAIQRQQVERQLDRLPARERLILEERYGLNGQPPRTLEELSRMLRISRERVRQLEARALLQLRRALC